MGSFYITTPIYYVNDEPHLGHAYTTVMADVLSRYHRVMGDDVFFLTGTDEHGQKVEQAARDRGLDPQAHADEMVVRFQDLWKRLSISNDDFIRTTDPRHTKVVQDILQRIYDAGEIYEDEYEGWYSVHDERFWTEKDLVDGKDPLSGREVVQIVERNYFFRMGKYQEWLIDHIEKHPEFIRPETRRNEILGFLKQPLGDLCISRPKSRLRWGVELPFDTDYVTYVWFDALINYISVPGFLTDDETFDRWWPASCHLIGKDILTTHCVYWPTMLKVMGIPMPETVMGHGWWMVDEQKMSKSLGNVIKPLELADKYGVDPFRYFLARDMVLGQDSSFSETGFVGRYNSELANDLGNLLNRTVVMADRYLDGVVPDVDSSSSTIDTLRGTADETRKAVEDLLPKLDTSRILEAIWRLVREANRFVETQAPWALAKDESKRQELEETIYGLLEVMRHVAVWTYPVMPERSQRMWEQLGQPGDISDSQITDLTWGALKAGIRVQPGDPVFPRIDEVDVEAESEPTTEEPEVPEEPKDEDQTEEPDNLITFNEFGKLELRVATVKEAEKVEGADRLLKLQITLGDEDRQIVAGVAQHYTPEDLVGRQIVIVANLAPAKIRGVESQGMLLAASDGDVVSLLLPDQELPPGSGVR
ncbi:MAG: methionine--tRNA ligase [Rhodospirillaceae bacterium]|nr:methionine--tRNA ligase [Rhodospirillaceae bacterium]